MRTQTIDKFVKELKDIPEEKVKSLFDYMEFLKKKNKTGKSDIQKLTDITEKLINEKKLDPKHKDHILTGNYKNHRECHIEPDWLLIYRIIDKEIFFIRT